MKKTLLTSIHQHLADFAQSLDIFCAEHFVATFNAEQVDTLLSYLGFEDDAIESIKLRLSRVRDSFVQFQSAHYFASGRVSFGLQAPRSDVHQFKPLPYSALNLPAKVDLLEQARLTAIRDQASRGTCSSHSVVKVVEMALNTEKSHSAAFNYYFSKVIDDNDEEGTTLQSSLLAVQQFGSCEERLAPYQDFIQTDPASTYSPNPIALKMAEKHRIDDWVVCAPNSDVMQQLKLLLSGGLSGKPRGIVVGVKVYKDQLNNLYSNRTGEWARPSPFTDNEDYYLHALALIGMHDADSENDASKVLCVQSYGAEYAKDGEFGSGIVTFSYEYLVENLVCFGTFLLPGEREQFIAVESSDLYAVAALANPDIKTPEVTFNYQPMSNNHVGIFGPSGSGKTTQACNFIKQSVTSYPKLSWHIFDLHREMEDRIGHLNPTIIDVESTGLYFPLISNLRGSAADIKVRSLSNDLQAASLSMGIHQIEELNKLLEIAIASGIQKNLDLKQFLEDNLESKLRNHIGEFLMLLRSNTVIDQNKPGIFIHDLSAFDELPICRALYAISVLRYSKNIQFDDATQPVMLVFEEAELLLNGRSNNALKRQLQEGRKLNLGCMVIAQQKPNDKWLTNNLNQIIELENRPAMPSTFSKVDVEAIRQSRFTSPKPSQANWLGKITHLLN